MTDTRTVPVEPIGDMEGVFYKALEEHGTRNFYPVWQDLLRAACAALAQSQPKETAAQQTVGSPLKGEQHTPPVDAAPLSDAEIDSIEKWMLEVEIVGHHHWIKQLCAQAKRAIPRDNGELVKRLRDVRVNNPFAGHADLCDEAADALSRSAEPVATGYYLQDSRTYVGNDVMWWAQNGKGYTSDLRKAHIFTEAEASKGASRETDLFWPKAYIDTISRPAVDYQYLDKTKLYLRGSDTK